MNLRSRFNLFLLPNVAFGLLTVAAFTIYLSINAMQQNALEQLEAKQGLIAKSIAYWVDSNRQMLSSLANSPVVTDALTTSAKQAHASAHFASVADSYGYRNIAILNQDGTAIAASNPARVGKDYGHLSYVQQAQSTNEIVISSPRASRVDGTLLISFAKQIRSETGSTRGSIFLSVPLNNFYQQHVDVTQESPNSYAFILTQDCQPLAYRDMQTKSQPHFDKLCRQTGVQHNFSDNGIEYLAISHREPTTGWYIITATKQQVLDDSFTALSSSAAFIAILAIIIMVFVVIKLVGIITQGLSTITAAADDLADGDIELHHLDQNKWRMQLNRKDELGHMANAMQRLIDNQQHQVRTAQRIAHGELMHQIRHASKHDVLGQALTSMQASLKTLVSSVKTTSMQVSSATESLNNDGQHLAEGATEQLASVSSISAALQEIDSQIQLTAQSAMQMNQQGQQTLTAAEEGNVHISQLTESLQAINDSGAQIADIMKEITNIAEQTNLIALNAAIEAARAGEFGRGFSVVADEVRNLASRSAQAANKTSSLVNHSLEKMAEGNQIADQTATVFANIVEQVTTSAEQLDAIAQGSQEQAGATAELTEGLAQIDSVGQHVTAIANQVALQSQELAELTEQLQHASSQFKSNE
ncbi:hypothetical protein G3R49_00070 [Shewanella sp. WXL01]|uniref:methyl-accepting chemotaxis protein n=1 Tax=Shewanella sp. WXL01 TaxID=2709721 RepID=UPI0014384C20|nr:methyl-accepting chemotaxis protein [Shewanella sp. WXL01]NKF48969.1 hypothetical protein [Shewanella sp. WXL01]